MMKYLTNLSPKMKPVVEGLKAFPVPLRGITVTAASALAKESTKDGCYRVAKRLLRRLEKAGVGQYVVGRRGHPSRFISKQLDLRKLEVGYSDKSEQADKLGQEIGWSEGGLVWQGEIGTEVVNAKSVPTQTSERAERVEKVADTVPDKPSETITVSSALKKLNLRFEQQYEKVKSSLSKGDVGSALAAMEWFVGYLESYESSVRH